MSQTSGVTSHDVVLEGPGEDFARVGWPDVARFRRGVLSAELRLQRLLESGEVGRVEWIENERLRAGAEVFHSHRWVLDVDGDMIHPHAGPAEWIRGRATLTAISARGIEIEMRRTRADTWEFTRARQAS